MKYFASICFLLIVLSVFGQNHDNVWIFGYGSNTIDSSFGGSVINFNNSPPSVSYSFIPMNMYVTNASICDTDGNLQFYSNGVYIENYLGQQIEGIDTLNPGPVANSASSLGYPLFQGALILPLPGSDSIYYLFHMTAEYPTGGLGIHVSGLYYTSVDMSMNSGSGGLIGIREPVLIDTLTPGNLTVTKHANGLDWWISVKEYRSNKFYKILFTANGIEQILEQTIGENPWGSGSATTFSPDGSKYIEFSGGTLVFGKFLEVFDFNRCNGILSNPKFMNFFDDNYFAGVAVSPNSRFLYLSSGFYIYQFDLEAEDVFASKDTVAIYDGATSPFSTLFMTAQLAPDGKIYINSPGGNTTLHVIHQPDVKGASCMVEQNGIQLPTYNASSMPNFPNYRLGPIPPITPSFVYQAFGDSVLFQNTSIGGEAYAWDFGDGSTGTGSEIWHVYAQPGSYPVTLTVSHDCLSEVATDTVSVVFTGVGEVRGGGGLRVFPNPAKNMVQLSFGPRDAKGMLVVTDVFGWRVTTQQVPENTVSLALVTESWEPGMYFLNLVFEGDKPSVQSIIISR